LYFYPVLPSKNGSTWVISASNTILIRRRAAVLRATVTAQSMHWENRAGSAAARTPAVDQMSSRKDVPWPSSRVTPVIPR
jgi:hypothetical protein